MLQADGRAVTIRNVNDVLQGRSDISVDMLLSALREEGGPGHVREVDGIQAQIEAFQNQRALCGKPYTRTGNQAYQYELRDSDPQRPLKIISQELFDHAAEHGFPPDFFKESYFDHVTIYCMPDGADCTFSRFQNCFFSVCGIRGAVFDHAALYDSLFHSSLLHMVNFTEASLAQTHFWDNELSSVSFQDARLKSCLMLDCAMDRVDFQGATLDGSGFGRINARDILNLHRASITQGGATATEVRRLHTLIYQELGETIPPVKRRPQTNRRRKASAPER